MFIFCFNVFFILETILLEKTPAFAIDYLFTQILNSYQHCSDGDNDSYTDV